MAALCSIFQIGSVRNYEPGTLEPFFQIVTLGCSVVERRRDILLWDNMGRPPLFYPLKYVFNFVYIGFNKQIYLKANTSHFSPFLILKKKYAVHKQRATFWS